MLDRRSFVTRLLGSTALLGAASLGLFPRNGIASLPLTPSQAEGPYYPVTWPDDRDFDLLRFASAEKTAKGIPLELIGQVLGQDGTPRPNLRIDIWQADADGIYDHPDAPNTDIFDREFQGAGQTVTDQDGGYRFLTLVPTPYTGRPPHIHVKIWDGSEELLTTQLYLKDHPDNEKNDGVLGSFFFRNTDKLLMTLSPALLEGDLQGQKTRYDFVV